MPSFKQVRALLRPRSTSKSPSPQRPTTHAESSPPNAIPANPDKEDALGLHLLYPPPSGPSASPHAVRFDFFAVHGLGGSPYKTWRHDDGHIWLRDSLPRDIRGSRVFSFGYNADPVQNSAKAGIDDFARQLLESISDVSKDTTYPIVFICHSLGGIVVKQAIVRASLEREYYGDILDRVKVIMFLGTPHRGSAIAKYAEALLRIKNAKGGLIPFWGYARTDLLELLKRNSEELDVITNNFRNFADRFKIISGYENGWYPGTNCYVVEKNSALLHWSNERDVPLNGHHAAICRFSPNAKDASMPNYRLLAHALEVALRKIGLPQPILQAASPLSNETVSVQSLTTSESAFVQSFGDLEWDCGDMLAYRHETSCEWIKQDSCFHQWYEGSARLLWVTGEAGTGKSMISASITQFLRDESSRKGRKRAKPIILSVFCQEGLPASHRDAKAVFRNLMLQMARRDKAALKTFRKVFKLHQTREHSLPSIDKAFKLALQNLDCKDVYIVLDGLDGLSDRKVLLKHLWGLAEPALPTPAYSLKILLSCHPTFPNELSPFPDRDNLSLRIQLESYPQGLICDIANFIDSSFAEMMAQRDINKDQAELYGRTVKSNARGSFLWTKLIIKEVRDRAAVSADYIDSLMLEPPQSLTEYYAQCLPHVRPDDDKLLKTLLHFLVSALRPLTDQELSLLLVVQDNMTEDQLNRKVSSSMKIAKSLLGPLVRISETTRTIDLIHPSVRSFLLAVGQDIDHPLHQTHGVQLEAAHSALGTACIQYLTMGEFDKDLLLFEDDSSENAMTPPHAADDALFGDMFEVEDPSERLGNATSALKRKHPAYEYAALHWPLHVAHCAGPQEQQMTAKRMLDHRQSQAFGNWFHCVQSWTSSTNPSSSEMQEPLILSAFYGWHHVLNSPACEIEECKLDNIEKALSWAISKSQASTLEVILRAMESMQTILEKSRSRRPEKTPYVIAAAQTGSEEIVKAVLASTDDAINHPNETDQRGRSALHFAAKLNHAAVIKCLVRNSTTDINMRDGFELKTPLHHAAEGGSLEAVKSLIGCNPVKVDIKDKWGRTAFSYAAEGGFTDIMEALLSRVSQCRELPDETGRTPTSYAMENLHGKSAELLLKNGCSLLTFDKDGRNPVSWAANGHNPLRKSDEQSHLRAEICSMAASHDPTAMDLPDVSGWTPLFWAVEPPGYLEVINVILGVPSVDVNRRDLSNSTVLHWAVRSNLSAIVERFLEREDMDVLAVDDYGRTALWHAARKGDYYMANMLLNRAPESARLADQSASFPIDVVSHGQDELMRLLQF